MNKVKVRFIAIVSLIAALVLTLAIAAGAAVTGRVFASAEVTAVEYAPDSVFASGGVAGEVGASEGEESYVLFTFRDGGKVYFRRDLAYKWFSADTENTQSTLANPGKVNYLQMQFSLTGLDFEKFTISFESAEESVSKDKKAVNDVVFRVKDGALQVAVRDADHRTAEDEELAWSNLSGESSSDIALSFGEGVGIGEYTVTVACGTAVVEGVFTNIGGSYSDYRSSSSSSPNTPIVFSMDMPEGAQSDAKAEVLMKSLNGQSFLLENGKVMDDTAPVLAVSEDVYAFTLGKSFSFTSYEAIDVCKDTVAVSRDYYMAKPTEDGYAIADESATGSSSVYKRLTSSTYLMPTSDRGEIVDEYISVRFSLNDGRKREDADVVSDYIYLSWYAADTSAEGGIVATLAASDAEDALRHDFIIVTANDEAEGPYYVGLTADEETKTNVVSQTFEENVANYQAAIDEAAQNTGAGSGSYLNLPSLRALIASDYADYRNLRFTIYYWHESDALGSSPTSTSSLSYNGLRFEVEKEGRYMFRIVASDALGNSMKLYNTQGELVTVGSSSIGYGNDGENFRIAEIPTFTAYIDYNGATIEDAGMQQYGYRDRTYSIDSFDVIALEGYESDYTLYYFDTTRLAADQSVPSYSECVENAYEYFFAENAVYKNAIVEINVYNSDVTEDDEAWDDTDNAYQWNPDSSLSFVPQRSGIYIVGLTVTETTGATVSSYMAIEVRNPVDVIPGVSEWLQNNTVSVVLFSISGVLLIAIIVLIVIKPSDKNVETVDIEKLKGKKSNKSKKN